MERIAFTRGQNYRGSRPTKKTARQDNGWPNKEGVPYDMLQKKLLLQQQGFSEGIVWF